MIKNELEYQVTQEWVEKFEKSIVALEQDETKKANEPDGWVNSRRVLQYHLDALKQEVTEYETVTSHDERTPIVLKLDDIDYLAQIPIKARIAAKLSHKELADLAGLTEEKICQYEANDYQTASFIDVMSIIDALDIKIQQCEFLVPLDTLKRTPITKEELLSTSLNLKKKPVDELKV